MFAQVGISCLLFASALSIPVPENPSPYDPPVNSLYDPYEKPFIEEVKRPYAFNYGVKDDHTGAEYGHQEDSDGEIIKGSYTVALPDGRLQRVTYTADHVHGFQAEVTYEGEANYPEYIPEEPVYGKEASQQNQGPNQYKPQLQYSAPKPSYLPSPRFNEGTPVFAQEEGNEQQFHDLE